jgi:cobalamin biosynthesis protein CbiD
VQGLGICLEAEAKAETIEKVKGRANRRVRVDTPMVDKAEVEKSF